MNILRLEAVQQLSIRPFSLKKLLNVMTLWRQRSKMRQQLSQLPDYRLKDMGISAEQAIVESQKPFWEK